MPRRQCMSFEMLETRSMLTAVCSPGRDDWTVGLVACNSDAAVGYTLVAPNNAADAYLVDVHGREVHAWTGGAYDNRFAAYVGQDGSLVSTGILPGGLFAAGATGAIWKQDWEGNLTWSWTYSSSTFKTHHDIEVMPNGNVLATAWVLRPNADLIAAGLSFPPIDGMYTERIIEVRPTGPTSGTIVWQWDVWDHLVQDVDPTKDNFGPVEDHPELVDLNFSAGNRRDWLHLNGIDYHERLDQIVVSSWNFDEIWVIDHSTTTAEAATHSGGNSGRGGDLLYRWGNPQAYRTDGVKQLDGQHDAQWVEEGYPGEDNILIFNNNRDATTTLVEIVPPVQNDGNYTLVPGTAYGPALPTWTYDTGTRVANMGGTQRLSNGNSLIAIGQGTRRGEIFEVTPTGQTAWSYINPASGFGVTSQGNQPSSANSVFKARRYSADFSGFAGRDLVPTGYVENWLLGDYDLNWEIAAADVDALCAGFVTGDRIFDLNFDDVVDGQDITEMIAGLLGLKLGDANLDGFVDGQDFLIWNTNKFEAHNLWSRGDFNCDGFIDGQDFLIWNVHKFTTSLPVGRPAHGSGVGRSSHSAHSNGGALGAGLPTPSANRPQVSMNHQKTEVLGDLRSSGGAGSGDYCCKRLWKHKHA